MLSELHVIGNYAVSNLTLRHDYKRAASKYLLDSISKGPSHIVKNNLDVTFFFYYKLKCLQKKH